MLKFLLPVIKKIGNLEILDNKTTETLDYIYKKKIYEDKWKEIIKICFLYSKANTEYKRKVFNYEMRVYLLINKTKLNY